MIKIEDISHVRFRAPDLPRMQAFLEDFGLACFKQGDLLYARGADGAPFAHVTESGPAGFVALGFRAASVEDLHKLAEFDGVPVTSFDAPGGGAIVRLRDPDGHIVEVVAGQSLAVPGPACPDIPFNSAVARRRLRMPVRLKGGPAHVRRLGHAVLNVGNFHASERWYKERFGFITSDEIEAAPDTPMGAFLRCDRGDHPTDHHTLFLAQLPSGRGFNHAAFEVSGFDDLMLGHQHLKAKKYKAAWGVGRHKLGSQIFDYWKDPWGHELEHWTDGDLFTAADGSNRATVEDLLGVQWGATFPALTGRFAPSIDRLGWIMSLSIRMRRRLGRDKRPSARSR